jgi:hypothetical protein
MYVMYPDESGDVAYQFRFNARHIESSRNTFQQHIGGLAGERVLQVVRRSLEYGFAEERRH